MAMTVKKITLGEKRLRIGREFLLGLSRRLLTLGQTSTLCWDIAIEVTNRRVRSRFIRLRGRSPLLRLRKRVSARRHSRSAGRGR